MPRSSSGGSLSATICSNRDRSPAPSGAADQTWNRVSAATMRHVETVADAGFYADIAVGLGSVWLADDTRHAVVRVDPARGVVARRYALGGAPFGVAVGAGAAWATSDDGTVVRIDPARGRVEVIDVGGAPRSLDVSGRTVWVSVD